ncbi:hypothetical protein [Parasphingopyxis lamellibrachiae]|uniref:Uncharacterized protein n=1 Tax=Parasphingopyxis lamellibrachiae TaxID=680125 RepID=A0A3D9FG81_9SPHN|nr:hypothetical protein [Parasphingopyxis lamellibrachiae]RED16126.1 hypothetical protein DFR46_1140 [Parasphingopyxis lamellibrachiae]
MSDTTAAAGLAPLVRALAKRSRAQPILENARSTPWSSITFTGARHRFSLRFESDRAARHAHAMCDGLNYAEFELGAHLLVDIAILDNRVSATGCTLTVEALTIAND